MKIKNYSYKVENRIVWIYGDDFLLLAEPNNPETRERFESDEEAEKYAPQIMLSQKENDEYNTMLLYFSKEVIPNIELKTDIPKNTGPIFEGLVPDEEEVELKANRSGSKSLEIASEFFGRY